MKIKVVKKEESRFFPMVKGLFEVEYAGATPAKKELAAEISKAIGRDEKLVIIKKVSSKYGEQECMVEANIYLNENAMNSMEKNYLLKRNGKIQEKKEEAKQEE